jgi:beta-glucanase (GH16 family)
MKAENNLLLKMTKKVIIGFLTPAMICLMSCGDGTGDTPGHSQRNYELVWSDEFDGEAGASPDGSKWTYDIGGGVNGWGNNELQYYTNDPKNVSLDGDGYLVITALKESLGGKAYTSARIKTQGIFQQTYGRFEARLKTPYGKGLWPAFWMLGANIEEVSWPQCGEIDVMELIGQQPFEVHGTIHGPGYSAGNAITSSFQNEGVRFDTEFHEFAVEWGEDFIEFFVDDERYHSIKPQNVPGEWVFNDDFFLILNVAVGGNWPGAPNSTTFFPQKMEIDYVRVYQEIE